MKRLTDWVKKYTVDLGFWTEDTQDGDGGIGTTARSSRGFGLRIVKKQDGAA